MFNKPSVRSIFGFALIAAPIIATLAAAYPSDPFQPSSASIQTSSGAATQSAINQSIKQMNNSIATQKQQNQAYLQQVIQQISQAGDINTSGATSSANNPPTMNNTAGAATQAATNKPAAAQNTNPAPPTTATGLPTNNTPSNNGVESWPLGF